MQCVYMWGDGWCECMYVVSVCVCVICVCVCVCMKPEKIEQKNENLPLFLSVLSISLSWAIVFKRLIIFALQKRIIKYKFFAVICHGETVEREGEL